MILSFSRLKFVPRIMNGTKIHTFREDKHNRWRPDMTIQFWFGNPRNIPSARKKGGDEIIPHQFGTGSVTIVVPAKILDSGILLSKTYYSNIVTLDDMARRDGFDGWEEMKSFFRDKLPWEGKLIFWKDFKTIE